PDRVFVLRLAGERAIQIDEVQTAGTTVDPMSGHCRRFLGKYRSLVHIALFEAYTLPVFQVDGGDQQHANRVLSSKGLKVGGSGWPASAPKRRFASLVQLFRRPCRAPCGSEVAVLLSRRATSTPLV